MTRDEIEALEGVALAEAVARDVMGWVPFGPPHGEQFWNDGGIGRDISKYPRQCSTINFRPDHSWNHAAEVMAKVCELHGGSWSIVASFSNKSNLIRVFFHSRLLAGRWELLGKNGPAAICRVALWVASELERPA